MRKIFSFLIVGLFSIQFVFADSAKKNPDVEEALRLTQEMLKNPAVRQTQINQSPEGKAVDTKVKENAGSAENEQAIYELAASVFSSMSDQAGGDPEKMQKILDEALKNPQGFASQWSPEQVKKLEEISAKSNSVKSEKPQKKLGPSKVTERPIKK
ncbi:MAG: hypothetical protein IT286_04785 [Proteobacteria bacterium]|jgi:hypothetical protein|nr:hypothetical protein [Pseudomonadota bacterium]